MTKQTGHDLLLKRPRRPRQIGLRLIRYRVAALLAVLGPGFITANVDNDPGGILTYSQAGAKYGYALLWTLIPTTIALIVVQEMASRMAVATGKGLSDLIREEFGLRITFFTMAVLSLADLGNIFAEFAGIASGMGIFGVSKYLAVPAGAVLVWLVIVKGTYNPVERILVIGSLIYFAYPVSAFLAHPDWHTALIKTVVPEFRHDPAYLTMIVGLIGTTITPWMQFYLQACVVEKGVTAREYPVARWDVIIGCIVTDVIAFFIVVACAATLHQSGHGEINDAAEAAVALKPFAGQVRGGAVRPGPGERRTAFRGHSAPGHGLQRLRGPGLRIRRGPALLGGPDFLFALHRTDRAGRRCGAASRHPAAQDDPALPGGQRRADPLRPDLHAAPGQ